MLWLEEMVIKTRVGSGDGSGGRLVVLQGNPSVKHEIVARINHEMCIRHMVADYTLAQLDRRLMSMAVHQHGLRSIAERRRRQAVTRTLNTRPLKRRNTTADGRLPNGAACEACVRGKVKCTHRINTDTGMIWLI